MTFPASPISLRALGPLAAAVVLLAAAAGPLRAQQEEESERYQLVKIERPTSSDLELLRDTDSDHIRRVPGGYEAALSVADVEMLRGEGVRIVVLVEDLERYYSARAAEDIARMRRTTPELLVRPAPSVPDFRFGSVAGYYTLEEVDAELARMSARFPRLAGARFSIGLSVQGREIPAIRLSARPASDSAVPEVLFTGLQHAREPIGMMSLIYSAWALLDGYGTDPEATWLLDNRALYLVPVVNPDGYRLNLVRFPQGGGLWRKNRGSGGGVDLNRNYGPEEYWDDENRGSGERPGEITYRGPAPFSEPETRAVRDFCLSRSFRVALNFHSFSNLLIYPFDFDRRVPHDSALYRVASRELALENGYAPGVGRVAVGYPSRGIADEWMYAHGRPGDRIMSWAPELGSEEEGFWPRITRIPSLVAENHRMNLSALWIAGAYPRVTAVERVEREGRVRLRVVVRNVGRDPMDEPATVTLADEPVMVTIPPLASLEERVIEMPVPDRLAVDRLAVDRPAAGRGGRRELEVVIGYHGVPLRRRVATIVRPTRMLFREDFEGSLGRWRAGSWAEEEVEGRGSVLSDSPDRRYGEAELPNVVETRFPISLAGMDAVDLSFDARWVVEAKDHDARVEVRRAGDSVWTPLDAEYLQVGYDTTDGSRSHFRGDSRTWGRYHASLDRFAGDQILLRFVIHTPRGPFRATFDGVMIDDIVIEGSPAEISPSLTPAPTPEVSPEGASDVAPGAFGRWPAGAGAFRLLDLLGRRVDAGTSGAELRRAGGRLPSGYYTLIVSGDGRVDVDGIGHVSE